MESFDVMHYGLRPTNNSIAFLAENHAAAEDDDVVVVVKGKSQEMNLAQGLMLHWIKSMKCAFEDEDLAFEDVVI